MTKFENTQQTAEEKFDAWIKQEGIDRNNYQISFKPTYDGFKAQMIEIKPIKGGTELTAVQKTSLTTAFPELLGKEVAQLTFNVFDNVLFGDSDQFDIKAEYTRSITEPSIDLADSVATQAQFSRSLIEGSVEMFDSQFFGDSTQFDVQSQPAILLDDAIQAVKGADRAISDEFNPINDSLDRQLVASRNLPENIPITDALQRKLTAGREVTENIPFSDDVQRSYQPDRQLSDDIPITDDVLAQFTIIRNIVEPVIDILDSLGRTLLAARNLVENIPITDQVFASAVSQAVRRIKTASAYIAKRVTEAFIGKRSTSGDVVQMANFELVEGEVGDMYDISIFDRNNLDQYGKPQLISFSAKGITQATMFIAVTDDIATPLKTITLSLPNDYIARWTIAAADVPTKGDYYAQIKMFNVGGTLIRKTWEPLTMKVKPKTGS